MNPLVCVLHGSDPLQRHDCEGVVQARVQQGGNAGGNAGFMAEVNGNMPAMERGGNAANWAQQLGARFGL